MKIVLIPVLCLLLALLCACGKTPATSSETTEAAVESTSEATEPFSLDDGNFDHLKGDLPEGWTIHETFSTSSYLKASYGEGETAPLLTVSIYTYDDDMGAEKSRLLAEAAHGFREEDDVSEISKMKIGGLDFYHINYNSLQTEKTRCYVFYGQTVPDKNKEYRFIEIQLDNIKDAKQYESLKGVLDTLNFKF